MNRIDEILSRLYQYMGFSKDLEFCEKYHIKPNTLSTWKKRNKIPYELLEEISQNENLSMDWLLTGKGEMLLSEKNSLPTTLPKTDEDENAVSLNYYPDIVAAAGYGAINEHAYTKHTMKFDKTFLEEILNVRRFDKLDVIKVVGDSMEPYIQDGQIIIIERNPNAMNGETVIANVNGNIYVKRFHTDPFGKWVKLVSENKLYGTIELNTPEELGSFSIIGIVRAKIKAF